MKKENTNGILKEKSKGHKWMEKMENRENDQSQRESFIILNGMKNSQLLMNKRQHRSPISKTQKELLSQSL